MPRDLRRYSRQTTTRLLVGALILLFLIGGGLILNFYGTGAAVMGILCLSAALFPVVLIILVLWILDWILKRERSK